MARSTKAEKARQLNAARGLLQRHVALPEAVRRLSREFDLSERQAYRYLEEASQLDRPVEVTEATVPITLKLPPRTVELLRKSAKSSGLTIGAIVAGALNVASVGTLNLVGSAGALYLDGALTTAGRLAERGALLVDLSGQHQHQGLVDPVRRHRDPGQRRHRARPERAGVHPGDPGRR